jgi:hypothetical protein
MLDGLLPSPTTETDPLVAQMLLLISLGIAYHFGDPNEVPPVAYARALGYRNLAEFLDGAKKDGWARHQAVQQRLFVKFGMSLENLRAKGKNLEDQTESFAHGLGRIGETLPENYHQFFAAFASRFGPLTA